MNSAEHAMAEVSRMIGKVREAGDRLRQPGVGGSSDVDQAWELPYDEYKYLENNHLRPLLLSLANEADGALNHALRFLELAKKEEEADEVARKKEEKRKEKAAKKKEKAAYGVGKKKTGPWDYPTQAGSALSKEGKAGSTGRPSSRYVLGHDLIDVSPEDMLGSKTKKELSVVSTLGQTGKDKLDFYDDKKSKLGQWVEETKVVVDDLEKNFFTGDIFRRNSVIMGVKMASTSREQESFPVINRYVFNEVEGKVKKVRRMVSHLRKILERSDGEPISSYADSFIREEKLRAWRLAYSRVDCVESDVVGIEENVQELVTQLIKDDGVEGRNYFRPRWFCICGMGGIGKTTLAKQIYHHTQIRSHFDALAWASVSDNNVDLVDLGNELEEQILTQLPNDEWEQETNNKYLVILDDIWSTKIWKYLKFTKIFGSIRFLVTTRIVLDFPNDVRHELRCLEEKQSWELFEKKANFRRNASEDLEDYNERKELAQRMLECCAGLPLAITVLGEVLSDKHTIDEFQKVFHNNFKTHLIGGEVNELGELNFSYISWVLSLSYQALPLYLKPCLLQLAQFPKDCEIRVKELSRMWMAEGLVSVSQWSPTRKPLEEEAYLCVENLVERCVIKVEKLDLHGRIKAVRIHNLMREFCLLRAKEESFQEVIDSRNIQEKVDSFSSGTVAYVVPTHKPRIALYLNEDVAGEFFPLFNDDGAHKQLSSFICFNRLPYPSYEKVMERLLNCFHNLRVLKFENLTYGYIGKLPEEIGELLQLRFLSLKGSHVEQVPSSIENLTWLQHFDLRTNWDVELPNVIGKLEKLRHFYLPRRCSVSGNKLRLGTRMQLQTLVNVPGIYCDINDLKVLAQVTKLKLYFYAKWWKDMDPEISSLVFDHLQSLALENLSRAKVDVVTLISRCLRICKLQIEGKIVKLPEDEKFFPKLIKLTLIRTDLEDDPMGTLEELPNLRILILNHNSFRGKEMVCSSGGFPALESLSLIRLDHLKEWRVEEGALPRLGYLLIEDCSELEAIPDGVTCVTALQKLVVKRMSREFKMKIEEGGEDFDKVRHVPEIELMD